MPIDKDRPVFSVIIPTYSRDEYLVKAINSVIEQTFESFECIVVDDGESEVAEKHIEALNDRRFKYLRNNRTSGGNGARNTGLEASKGELIAFLDDDDLWLPTKLQAHFEEHSAQNKPCVVYSGVINYFELPKFDYTVVNQSPKLKGSAHLAMKEHMFCPSTSSSVSVNKICFEVVGNFDEILPSFQDWDMWYRISKEFTFYNIQAAHVIFRHHSEDRITSSIEKRKQGISRVLLKHKEMSQKAFERHHLFNLYSSQAIDSISLGSLRNSWNYMFQAMKFIDRRSNLGLLMTFIFPMIFGQRNYVRFRTFFSRNIWSGPLEKKS